MKRFILLVLLVTGCTMRAPVPAVSVIQTADGTNVYMTRDTWDRLFGPSVSTTIADGNLVIATLHGHYDRKTDICRVVADDPSHPTSLEQNYMLHEIGHRLMCKYGWNTARPVWLWLAWNEPGVMTHPAINARLMRDGQWPATWPLTLLK